jgi:hypothetical protein
MRLAFLFSLLFIVAQTESATVKLNDLTQNFDQLIAINNEIATYLKDEVLLWASSSSSLLKVEKAVGIGTCAIAFTTCVLAPPLCPGAAIGIYIGVGGYLATEPHDIYLRYQVYQNVFNQLSKRKPYLNQIVELFRKVPEVNELVRILMDQDKTLTIDASLYAIIVQFLGDKGAGYLEMIEQNWSNIKTHEGTIVKATIGTAADNKFGTGAIDKVIAGAKLLIEAGGIKLIAGGIYVTAEGALLIYNWGKTHPSVDKIIQVIDELYNQNQILSKLKCQLKHSAENKAPPCG